MMTDRKKLVELLESHCAVIGEEKCKAAKEETCSPRDCAGCLADHLIANGVTVQQWTPVTEKLPKPIDPVLCIGTRGGMFIGYHYYSIERSMDKSICFRVPNSRRDRYASHWQPLPEALKTREEQTDV